MAKYDLNDLAIIALDNLGITDYDKKRDVLKLFNSPYELLTVSDEKLAIIGKIIGENKIGGLKLSLNREYIDEITDNLDKKSITAITYLSKKYPALLKETPLAPLVIYAKGNIDLLNSNCFAIVGSRKTLPNSLKISENIASELSSLGITVVTGSADGGDRSAILGALSSGNIISVLAHGHDMIYPESNRDLIEKVASSGLVISEYPPSFPARSWTFPIRNRIIAGLSRGVLIISGEKKSGARHTANFATEYNREVFALPYSIGIKSGELCNELIKNGAYLCDSVDDITFALGIDKQEKEEKIDLSVEESAVYIAIKDGLDSAVLLMNKTGLKAYEIMPILSSLELKGLIVKLMGNKFKAVK